MHLPIEPYTHRQGVVYMKTLGHYLVSDGEQEITCAISPRLRKKLIYPTAAPSSLRHAVREVADIDAVDPVAIGDQVHFVDTQDGSGLIVEVLPRRNRLARLAAGRKPLEQVIVANLDYVVPVFAAAQPEPKWNLLDRYLASAESLGLDSLVCITKIDLSDNGWDFRAEVDTYRRAGYPVILTSAVTGEGIDELKSALRGRVSVLTGKSGVGKTSLLNALQPGLGLSVSEVSRATNKGRHTTSNLAMYPLEHGGFIVDTPGMREFGLWEVEDEDLAQFFPEMRKYIARCRFGLDCGHDQEPGCAIRAAVQRGEVSTRRYKSMLKLNEE
jgi:ribosome biogenesis GTPase / thiamine phosphate phosphatase